MFNRYSLQCDCRRRIAGDASGNSEVSGTIYGFHLLEIQHLFDLKCHPLCRMQFAGVNLYSNGLSVTRCKQHSVAGATDRPALGLVRYDRLH